MIIFQQFDNVFEEIKQVVIPHNEKYCQKYNIKYEVFIKYEIDNNLKKYWNKIIYLNKLLQCSSEEWILMLDGDIILYPENNIELITKLISQSKHFGVCRVSDKLSDHLWNINIGSLFVKNTDFCKKIITDMIFIGEQQNFNIYEQPIFQNMLKSNYMGLIEKTEIFAPQAFNHTGGPFVFHPCGSEETTTQNINAIDIKVKKIKQEIERLL